MSETTADPVPRHARQRAAPAAAARNRAARQAAVKPKKAPAPKVKATPQQMAAGYAADKGAQAARAADRARIPTGNRQYQNVILAEFLAAVVLVAALPLATGGSPNAKAKGGLSPYDAGDLRQLLGIGAVYFILALLSSGNRGRFAAWFGGLVLLGIGFAKTAQIKEAAQALAPQPATQ